MKSAVEFWKHKKLNEMNPEEWEALCDGCGICCLFKVEDEDTGEIGLTCVACRFLDPKRIVCQLYDKRSIVVPTCIQLTPAKVKELDWLPDTCAYRLILHGKPLPDWHPLVSGNPKSVHQAGISIKGRYLSESDVDLDQLEEYVIEELGSFEEKGELKNAE